MVYNIVYNQKWAGNAKKHKITRRFMYSGRKGYSMYRIKRLISKLKLRKKESSPERKKNRLYIWVSAVCNLLVAVAVILGLFIAEPIRQFDFKVGDIATENITAHRDIEDEYSTQLLIDEAVSAVQDIYVKDRNKTDEIYDKVRSGIQYAGSAFDEIHAQFVGWREDKLASFEHPGEPDPSWEENSAEYLEYLNALDKYNSANTYYTEMVFADVLKDNALFEQVFTQTFWNRLINEVSYYYSLEELKVIAYIHEDDIAFIEGEVSNIIFAAVEAGIKKSELEDAVEGIMARIGSYGYTKSSEIMTVLDVVTSHITYNTFLDEDATSEAKKLAEAGVEPIVYKKGQIIITAGQPITQAQYNLIDALGMLESGANEYSNYISLAIAILLMCGIQFAMFTIYRKSAVVNPKNSIIIALLSVISMYLYILLKSQNVYICTPLIAIMLVSMLINGKTAIMAGIPLSVFAGMYAGGDFSVTFSFLVACTLCACMMRRVSTSRSMVIIIGLCSAVVESIGALSMEYYTTAKLAMVGVNSFWIFMGGVLASILAIGLLSVFEYLFGIITPIRLLELSNQSQPILKRLQIEATGTYHHSIIVGNLAETAAYDIGADGLLARVGSYYHDIGKITNPRMFKENQADDHNPHDELPPEISARIIISHVKDGLKLAKQYHVPKLMHQFIEEHHGSTIASYFYVNACNLYGNENVNIEDYRYSGKTPSTKECAIVMLADTVEAAVRSMKTHSPEEIQKMIDKLVEGKIDAGQLDNCPLTFMEITVIKHTFLTILSGTYHNRVEYPKLREKDDNE